MFNVGYSYIVVELAPLLIHIQSDDIAANTDGFSFVSVRTEQSCMLLEYFTPILRLSSTKTADEPEFSDILIMQISDKSLFDIRLHSLKILMNPEMINDSAAALNERDIYCTRTNGYNSV